MSCSGKKERLLALLFRAKALSELLALVRWPSALSGFARQAHACSFSRQAVCTNPVALCSRNKARVQTRPKQAVSENAPYLSCMSIGAIQIPLIIKLR